MSTLELLVVVVGAPAGYWLVNFLLRGPGDAARARSASRPDGEPGGPTPPRSSSPPPAPPAPPHWSQVLEVPRDAGPEAIREAYRRQVARYHPDKVASLGQDLQDLAHRKTAEITEAYRDAIADRAAPGSRGAGEGGA